MAGGPWDGRAEWRGDAGQERPVYQVWNEPKRGCWATIVSGRGPEDRGAATRFGACLALYICGAGTTTRAIWSIFGSATSSDGGSWANASRTRALADISAVTAGTGAGLTAAGTLAGA